MIYSTVELSAVTFHVIHFYGQMENKREESTQIYTLTSDVTGSQWFEPANFIDLRHLRKRFKNQRRVKAMVGEVRKFDKLLILVTVERVLKYEQQPFCHGKVGFCDRFLRDMVSILGIE